MSSVRDTPRSGTVRQLMALLEELNLSPGSFVQAIEALDLADAGSLLQYLREAVLSEDPSPESLLFHWRFLQLFPPAKYPKLQRLLYEVRHRSQVSKESTDVLDSETIEQVLYEMILSSLGVARNSTIRKVESRPCRVAFVRSMIRVLESLNSLAASDANLALLFRILNRHGNIQTYYSSDDVPRRTVQRMAELGYDVGYLVFGGQSIASIGPSKTEKPEAWPQKLVRVVKSVLGGREADPEVDIGVDRHGFFYRIKSDFELVKEHSDCNAGLRIVDALLALLQQRSQDMLRRGNLAVESQVCQLALELQHVRKLLTNDSAESPLPEQLTARRSAKLVPELLFDNTRFACCLFKPNGLFHTEISRLLLDPATPMIEFWLDPYPEFLGLATLYPGVNSRGQRVILVDTIEYDDRLLSLRGNNGTMRFMLNSTVIDAHRANAEKLLVCAGPYGKPVNFANFVKQFTSRSKSAAYYERYYFESVDPENTALAESLTGRFHYTVALGCNRPMRGVIDYGFTLLGGGSVDKLLTGETGVIEIDVGQYLDEHKLSRGAPRAEPGVPPEVNVAVHQRPAHHDEEIHTRKKKILDEATAEASGMLEGCACEIVERFDSEVIDAVKRIEYACFGGRERYDVNEFEARLIQKNAQIVFLKRNNKRIGFTLSYVSPNLGADDVFLDEIALLPEYQGKGLGTALLTLLMRWHTVQGAQSMYALTSYVRTEGLLPVMSSFYQRFCFQLVTDYGRKNIGDTILVRRPLGVFTPENAGAIKAILNEATSRLRGILENLHVHLYCGGACCLSPTSMAVGLGAQYDGEVLDAVQSLETVFPEELRYSRAHFIERLSYKDAYVLLVKEEDKPIAFCLGYQDPSLPRHATFLDSMAVRPDRQNLGIGTVLFQMMLALPELAQYTTAVFYCKEQNTEGVQLAQHYRKFGASVVRVEDDRICMVISIPASGRTVVPDKAGTDHAPRRRRQRRTG